MRFGHTRGRGAVAALLALAVLNALLTLGNQWPTPWPRLSAQIAPELLLLLLGLCGWLAWRGAAPTRVLRCLAALTLLGVLARYLDVTVQAVFGRALNPYWDGRYLGSVLALGGWSAWTILAGALVLLLAVALLYRLLLRAWRLLALALAARRERAVTALLAAMLLALCVLPIGADGRLSRALRTAFARPVTPAIAHQAGLLASQLWPGTASRPLATSPDFQAHSLAGLKGADVLVVFLESYGVCTLDDAAQQSALAPARARLAQQLDERGQGVVSARVRSPTFGGGSWLAHAALLTGVDTRDPGDYERLLASDRPSLVGLFRAQGWRTVAWMPGLQRPWPEGSFYGFERIADAQGIGYAGLPLGFWRIPDPAAMALLHRQELAAPAGTRAPRFVVFPTLASHAPFRPVPPFDGDWTRLATPQAYSAAQIAQALAQPADWSQARPAYLEAISASFDWLGSYLAGPAPRGLLTLVIGDHQPWAAVSGEGASWDVPVHAISADAQLLARFEALGFTRGLTPAPSAGAASAARPMEDLTALLLAAFDGRPIASLTGP